MSTNQALEKAILADDLPTISQLVSSSCSTATPLKALDLSARLSRPQSFSYLLSHDPTLITSLNTEPLLLSHDPTLITSLNTEPLLLSALTGSSVPVWRVILEHEPMAKNRRFGHFGTVVERCVMKGKKELLEYLLAEGARVETTGRPILLRAQVCGASQEIKDLLVKYGATTDFEGEESAEAG